MELDSPEFEKKFNAKDRLNCSGCGGVNFRITATNISNATIEEAVFMHCKNCSHPRLELI